MAERIEWQNASVVPLPENVLRGAELLFGVKFPDDYRECLRINHGGHPEPRDFTVRGGTASWGSCFAVLLSLDGGGPRTSGPSCRASPLMDSSRLGFSLSQRTAAVISYAWTFARTWPHLVWRIGHMKSAGMRAWFESRAVSPSCLLCSDKGS